MVEAPMGAVFQGKDAPPRARYTMRLRRALPALVLLLVLCALAGVTWLKVLDSVRARADGGACPSAPADPNRVQLRIYNATGREGLAKTVASQLSSRGYLILATENDPLAGIRPVESSAEVRYGPAGAKQAAQVRRQVPGATLYRDAREGAVIDLVIGEKYKRLSTPAELAKGRQGLIGPSKAAPAPAKAAVPSPSPSC
ncbi:MAG TPA: LytR C-terminal domain-containing protein [Mycobacteriales bacterium]|nr:LytR C-terminal domain-containing protein [Mycobacteriales bacterium]